MRAAHDAPYWCEENVWHLCADPRLASARCEVAIVTNVDRAVALFDQRAASPDTPVVWDYHVVLLACDDAGWTVWDLDTTLGFPEPAARWLARTFRAGPPHFAPMFRVLAAEAYRRELASDRRHMRAPDGDWQQPPPPWPPIGVGHTLDALIDPACPLPGVWLSLAELRVRCAEPWSPLRRASSVER